jgi:hypothetical protein
MDSARLRRLVEFGELLLGEVITAQEAAERDPSPATRRLYVRAVFTLIDGRSNEMRNYALSEQKERDIGLSSRDRRILEGQERKPWSARFLTIVTAFALALGVKHGIDLASREWADFEAAVGIRNRLVHPEQPADLRVSREDLELVQRAFRWYWRTVDALLSLPRLGGATD